MFIDIYSTYLDGYNLTTGGQSCRRHPWSDAQKGSAYARSLTHRGIRPNIYVSKDCRHQHVGYYVRKIGCTSDMHFRDPDMSMQEKYVAACKYLDGDEIKLKQERKLPKNILPVVGRGKEGLQVKIMKDGKVHRKQWTAGSFDTQLEQATQYLEGMRKILIPADQTCCFVNERHATIKNNTL